MKYNEDTKKEIIKQCNVCRGNIMAWLTSVNFDQEKECGVKSHLYNYCPACRVFEKRLRKK